MNRIVVMRLVLFVLSVSAFADSLTLKDGRVLSGTYLSGSTTALRFLLGDRVETYPITAVDRIGFSDSVPAPRSGTYPFGFLTSRHPHGNETNALTTPDISGEQERFCEVLQNYRESVMRSTNEPNAIRRASRREPDPFDWEGRIASERSGLTGKADYVVRVLEGVEPVEIKSGNCPRSGRPHDSHRYQVAAYCLLVGEALEANVRYGLIRYDDRNVRVEYTPTLRAELLNIMEEIRLSRKSNREQHISHNHYGTCRACGYRETFSESLA